MQPKTEEYQGVLNDVEKTLRRYDRRFYRRNSLKGAPTSELVTLWIELRRARRRFTEVTPPVAGVRHVLKYLD
jgi:hypothetical protein